MFQLEQAKVKTQEMEVTRKIQKDQTDAGLAQQKLQLEGQKVQIEAAKEGVRVQSQDKQAAERLRLEALKVLATPKQPSTPKGPSR
jgi:hypothetical protein